MKTHLIALALAMLTIGSLRGQVKIGDNPQNLNQASILELESITKALVITRVNDVQMNNIVPLRGALVYNTDHDCIHYYDGTRWVNICEEFDNTFTVSTRADYFSTINPAQSKDSTVVISQTENPDGSINYNYEVGLIRGANIVNSTINGDAKLQDRSVTNIKIQERTISPNRFGDGTNAGDLFRWNGFEWTLANESDILITEKDSIVGNEIIDATDGTLFRSGNGLDTPYTLDVSPQGIGTAEIADGAITNIKLDKLLIPLSGFAPAATNVDLGNQNIINLNDPANSLDAVNLQYLNGAIAASEALDNDTDDTNELQSLSLAADQLSISNDPTASPVDLSGYLDNTDEQDLSITGNSLSLSGDPTAAPIDLSGYVNNDTNELQSLSLAADQLSISNDPTASPVDLSGYLDNTTLATTNLSQTDANRSYDIGIGGTLSFTNGSLGVGTSGTPNATLETGGSFAASIVRQSTNFALNETHHTVILDSGVTTVTLPVSDASNTGRIYILKNRTGGAVNTNINYIDSSGNSISSITNVLIIQSDGLGTWEQIN